MSAPQALDDLRVLELADVKGQLCGKLLADLGADVVQMEPLGGSPVRRVGPYYQDRPSLNGSLAYWHYNTSKRSVTLNLDASDGQAIFRELARAADVVIETGEPGLMAHRGLAYDDLAEANPGLIYCSITPYGQTGPWAQYKASDLTLLASGGEMAICGYDAEDDAEDTPIAPGGGSGWHIGANYAFIAILLALQARDRTGVGDYIDLSVHDAIAVCTEGSFPEYIMTGGRPEPADGTACHGDPFAPGAVPLQGRAIRQLLPAPADHGGVPAPARMAGRARARQRAKGGPVPGP